MGPVLAGEAPLVIARASGSTLFDLDGRGYLDGNASWWTALLGHGHPRLLAVLREQSERLCHVALAGLTHEHAALLAEELVHAAPPGLSRVFFTDDGSTAVELALKVALQFHAQNGAPLRQRFLALSSAFHGETLGVTALGGVEVFRRPFGSVLMDVLHVAPEQGGPGRAFEALGAALRDAGDSVAALVVEPIVQGAGGMRFYDPSLLVEARRLTQEHGVLLVFDEVFTGYGRTGPMWAADHAGVSPDMLCLAKGFTAGVLPMAATLFTERLFEGFLGEPSRALYYGHTYCGHALGAALAREVLAIYRDEDILAAAGPKAAKLARAFRELGALEGVANARSLGMVGALDLVPRVPGRGEAPGASGYLASSGQRVAAAARERGVYLRPLGDVVYVCPALNISDADLDRLLQVLIESVTLVLRGP